MITEKRPVKFSWSPLKWSTKVNQERKRAPELVRQQWGHTAEMTSYYKSQSISLGIWRGRPVKKVKIEMLHNFCDGHRITVPLDASRER